MVIYYNKKIVLEKLIARVEYIKNISFFLILYEQNSTPEINFLMWFTQNIIIEYFSNYYQHQFQNVIQ